MKDLTGQTFGFLNVQWIHKEINYMKSTLSQGVFIDLCQRVVNHLKPTN